MDFKGNNSGIFIFASLFNQDQLLKGRICSSRSKFIPLKVDLLMIGFIIQGNKQEIKIVKMAETNPKET